MDSVLLDSTLQRAKTELLSAQLDSRNAAFQKRSNI